MSARPSEIAQALAEELERRGYLDHSIAVEVVRHLDPDSIYNNDGGNEAIAKPVLNAFNKLTKATVVWDRSELHWRKRNHNDAAGRIQN
jgi:hypothetical protein